jgi:hypothetical protein
MIRKVGVMYLLRKISSISFATVKSLKTLHCCDGEEHPILKLK